MYCFVAWYLLTCSHVVLLVDVLGEPEETNYTAAGAAVNTM